MNMKNLLIVLLSMLVTGCAEIRWYDGRDAAWDPPAGSGQSLLDQIPNWEHSSKTARR